MKTCPPAEQIFLLVKTNKQTKCVFSEGSKRWTSIVKYSQASFHLNALHRRCLSWLLTYCTEKAALIQQQFTENSLPVPLLWQFSSTCPFRRLVPGPVWVMSKISKMFFCFVLLCFYFFPPSFLMDKRVSQKSVASKKPPTADSRTELVRQHFCP